MPKHPPRHTPRVALLAAPLLILSLLFALLSPASAGAVSSKAHPLSMATRTVRLIHRDFPRSAWPMAVRVASCESTFNTDAVHYDSNGTRDLGLFQLNTGGTEQELLGLTHHRVTDLSLAYAPAWNVAAAALLYARDGWHPWSCAA